MSLQDIDPRFRELGQIALPAVAPADPHGGDDSGLAWLLSLTAFWAPVSTVDAVPVDAVQATVKSRQFDSTISKVEGMVWDQRTQKLARKHGLSVVNVTWEDTGRSKGSVWGPNISDMTMRASDHPVNHNPAIFTNFSITFSSGRQQ